MIVGGAINLAVFYAGLAISLFLFSQQEGDQRLLTGALLALIGVLVSVGLFVWFRRYPIHDPRPMPLPVRVSFAMFFVLLAGAGTAAILQVPNVFTWKLTPESMALMGSFFLAAACYFLFGLVRPSWQKACGQLWAFLAYDLVLIVPFLLRFATLSPNQLLNHTVYTLVLVYSGALAVYYLLVNKATRTGGVRGELQSREGSEAKHFSL